MSRRYLSSIWPERRGVLGTITRIEQPTLSNNDIIRNRFGDIDKSSDSRFIKQLRPYDINKKDFTRLGPGVSPIALRETRAQFGSIMKEYSSGVRKIDAELTAAKENLPVLTPEEKASAIKNQEEKADKEKQDLVSKKGAELRELLSLLRDDPEGYMARLLEAKANRFQKEFMQKHADDADNEIKKKSDQLAKEREEINGDIAEIHKKVETLKLALEGSKGIFRLEPITSALRKTPEQHQTKDQYHIINQYSKALAQAQSDPLTRKKAEQAGKEEMRNPHIDINTAIKSLSPDIQAAQDAIIDTKLDANQREKAIQDVLEKAIDTHTKLRASVSSDKNSRILNKEALIRQRLTKFLDEERAILQLASEMPDDNTMQNRKDALEAAVKKAISYTLQANVRDGILHKEASSRFIKQMEAVVTAHEAAKKVAEGSGNSEEIARINQIDSKMAQALRLIEHISPEVQEGIKGFRQKHSSVFSNEATGTIQDQNAALREIQRAIHAGSGASIKLDPAIIEYINRDTNTDSKGIGGIAHIAKGKFMDLDKRIGNSTDPNIYDTLLKHIGTYYDQRLEATKGTTSIAETESHNEVIAERDAAITEANRLYPERATKKIIRELQAMLQRRDKRLAELQEIETAIKRAEADKRRYEIDPEAERSRLDAKIIEQLESIKIQQKSVAELAAKELQAKRRFNKAERDRDKAKMDFDQAQRALALSKEDDKAAIDAAFLSRTPSIRPSSRRGRSLTPHPERTAFIPPKEVRSSSPQSMHSHIESPTPIQPTITVDSPKRSPVSPSSRSTYEERYRVPADQDIPPLDLGEPALPFPSSPHIIPPDIRPSQDEQRQSAITASKKTAEILRKAEREFHWAKEELEEAELATKEANACCEVENKALDVLKEMREQAGNLSAEDETQRLRFLDYLRQDFREDVKLLRQQYMMQMHHRALMWSAAIAALSQETLKVMEKLGTNQYSLVIRELTK